MIADRKGFTLIELIVVIIIIGILAAVAVPIMNKSLARAKRTEAITVLGMIRTAERIVRSTTGSYENFSQGNLQTNMQKYMARTDMDGQYNKNNNYGVFSGSYAITRNSANASEYCFMYLNNGRTGYSPPD